MPSPGHAQTYQTLSARLDAMHEDITRQSRQRLMAEVPDETLRLVKRLLVDLRRFAASTGRARIVPVLPQGGIHFSALSVLLGETRAKFQSHGMALRLHRPSPGSAQAMLDSAETDLASMISASTAEIRRLREKQAAGKTRQDGRQARNRW